MYFVSMLDELSKTRLSTIRHGKSDNIRPKIGAKMLLGSEEMKKVRSENGS